MYIEEEYEVIIRFATYFQYFFTYCYDSEEEWFNDILEYIQDIQDEIYVVATTLHNNSRKLELIEAYRRTFHIKFLA